MNIHVNNLSPQFTNQQLKDLFAQHGQVTSAEIELDLFTGQSRCFAYVEMQDDNEAQNAITNLNNTQLEGRTITLESVPEKRLQKGSYKVGTPIPFSFKQGRNKKQKGRRF